MEFAVMPDHLYGASVRINGRWLGIVDERPLTFKLEGTGRYAVLVELTPLATDPTGDVHPHPFARVITLDKGEIVAPDVMPDGSLHIRRADQRYHLHFIYPKSDAIGRASETIPLPLQTETVDIDHDGRLDTVETFATNRSGHVRVRSATGQILFNEVYPDNGVRVEVCDITRDGRPDLLIFWRENGEYDPLAEFRLQIWESPDGAVSSYQGFTGIKRLGLGDCLLERKKETPYRQLLEYYRYSRQPGESGQFTLERTEEQFLRRADTADESVDAFLTALITGNERGAATYLLNKNMLPELQRTIGEFYNYEQTKLSDTKYQLEVYRWIIPGYYDTERHFVLDITRQPDRVSEYKITAIT